MKKIVNLAALISSAATISNAADLPELQPSYRAPSVATPAFDWSGFYVGVIGG